MALGETVDGRADIYALGCVAYFLLTGRLVFEAEKTFQMIAKHLQADPIPPSERSGLTIPPDLERLVMKCLAKDPDQRPKSAAHLAEALEWVTVDRWGQDLARDWWEMKRVERGVQAGPESPARRTLVTYSQVPEV
jgi:serine/threonine-protein kinase